MGRKEIPGTCHPWAPGVGGGVWPTEASSQVHPELSRHRNDPGTDHHELRPGRRGHCALPLRTPMSLSWGSSPGAEPARGPSHPTPEGRGLGEASTWALPRGGGHSGSSGARRQGSGQGSLQAVSSPPLTTPSRAYPALGTQHNGYPLRPRARLPTMTVRSAAYKQGDLGQR